MKTRSFLLCITLCVAIMPAALGAVFFAAHPDDIVLMMGRNAFNDIRGGHPTVLVVVTAGDAGNGVSANAHGFDGNFDHNQQGKPYYRVRLDAHHAALSYWVNANSTPTIVKTSESFSAAIPEVEKIIIGNVIIYNLNLPDGKMEGFLPTGAYGFDPTRNTGIYSTLRDVTGRNYYTPASLKETLRQIIRRNNAGRRTVVINLPEHDPHFVQGGYNYQLIPDENGNLLNYGRIDAGILDHPDHTAVGRFVITAVNEQPAFHCLYKAVYMGYGIIRLPDSMNAAEKYHQEVATFQRMNGMLIHEGNVIGQPQEARPLAGNDDAFHRSFLGKQRWRDAGGGGVCGL